MSIQVELEKLLSFPQLARKLPSRRSGRPVHPSTIHRWRHPGVGGVRLKAIRIGGAWHTSWAAFQEFCEELTRGQESEVADEIGGTADAEHDRVDAELNAEGW